MIIAMLAKITRTQNMHYTSKKIGTLEDQIKLTKVLNSETVKNILKSCKNINFLARPSASEVVESFEKVYEDLVNGQFEVNAEELNSMNMSDVQRFNKNYFDDR